MKSSSLRGILFIAIGAASYGILATFVQLANNKGYGTAGLVFSQYIVGVLVLTILAFLQRKKHKKIAPAPSIVKNEKLKLLIFGTSLGFTSSFYYMSIQYIPVSVAIILLMQTIWIAVVVEFFTARNLINRTKVIGAIVALVGTVLAAKINESSVYLDYRGIGFGLLAAVSYTGTMYASNSIGTALPNIVRSQYLLYGGFIVVLLFWNYQIWTSFHWELFLKWGLFLGFFGTILPPILFNSAFPIVGTGLGGIIASLEIPVSVFSAYIVLSEEVTSMQWLGISIILVAVVLINWKQLSKY